jgi:surface protein
MSAIEYAPNGITIRATQPMEFYEGNQRHTLNGKEYFVPLSKEELKEYDDKEHCVTSFITDMSHMFRGATAFNQPIGAWDTSQVEDMGSMLYDASSFNQPIGTWDTGKVKYMGRMFLGATSFNQPIGAWDTSRMTDMCLMFNRATAFNQPIGAWNTS